MKAIASRDNPTFKQLRQLALDARASRKAGRTLIDGPHLVASHRHKLGLPAMLLTSDTGATNEEIAKLLENHRPLEPLRLRDSLFKELSGTDSPVGIMAVIDIPMEPRTPVEESCVMLDAVQDAGNVGSILRTAAAAGICDVLLGNGCAGAWTPRVLRAGQGAHFALRIRERINLADAVQSYPGKVIAASAHGGTSLYEVDLRGRIAWLFGSEGQGIAPNLQALARVGVTIPLAANHESLNVAAAAAVCLFEAVRQNSCR